MMTNRFGIGLLSLTVVLLSAGLLQVPVSVAQDDLSGDTAIPRWLRERLADRVYNRRDNSEMMRLVRPIAGQTLGSVVSVVSGGRPVAMGTVVSDGSQASVPSSLQGSLGGSPRRYVVTKRSELTGDPIRVQFRDGRMVPARVAAVRRRTDLALLVLEPNESDVASMRSQLTPIVWDAVIPSIGSFLVSPDRSGRVVGIGVVGTGPITVGHQGRLGVKLEPVDQSGARVEVIFPRSGADEAGLELGDRIVAIDGRIQQDIRTVVTTLKSMFPGEVVRLTIDRGGNTLDISAKLREAAIMNESENDARVNGPRNVRLSGFERVIQHDTVLDPNECGGPLLDIQGRVIGLNIARAGRVVSYALPASLVQSEVASMVSEARGK
ncbi:MAG: PDZ domain-containing protein [Planctomycetota bacterium]